jgi:hypothetical protein
VITFGREEAPALALRSPGWAFPARAGAWAEANNVEIAAPSPETLDAAHPGSA